MYVHIYIYIYVCTSLISSPYAAMNSRVTQWGSQLQSCQKREPRLK